jgi:hypothetical protein
MFLRNVRRQNVVLAFNLNAFHSHLPATSGRICFPRLAEQGTLPSFDQFTKNVRAAVGTSPAALMSQPTAAALGRHQGRIIDAYLCRAALRHVGGIDAGSVAVAEMF